MAINSQQRPRSMDRGGSSGSDVKADQQCHANAAADCILSAAWSHLPRYGAPSPDGLRLLEASKGVLCQHGCWAVRSRVQHLQLNAHPCLQSRQAFVGRR